MHGIDLMLRDHTHNGRGVPFNYAAKRRFPWIQGCYEHDSTTLYVSPGIDTWRPIPRLGSKSKVVEFVIQRTNISFNRPKLIVNVLMSGRLFGRSWPGWICSLF